MLWAGLERGRNLSLAPLSNLNSRLQVLSTAEPALLKAVCTDNRFSSVLTFCEGCLLLCLQPVRRKLSSEACTKAYPWGHRPQALSAAGQWALPTLMGASASCREAPGAGKWKPSDGCSWQCASLSFCKTCALRPLAFYLTEQSKYLCRISAHLFNIWKSALKGGVCVRTAWEIRSNVSVEVKAAAVLQ